MQARGRDITAHSVCEVYYDDSWHLIDSSVMNSFVKDDGKLASVDEINKALNGVGRVASQLTSAMMNPAKNSSQGAEEPL